MIKEKNKLVGVIKNKQQLKSKLGNAIIYIDPNMQEKIVEPQKEKQVITPDNGFVGLSKVTINKIADDYIIPDGNIEIEENGVFDITDKKNAIVNVPEKILGVKKISKNGFYQAQSDNFDGYSVVEVNVDTTTESSYKWQRPTDWYDLPKMMSEIEPIEYEDTVYYPRVGVQLEITNETDFTIPVYSMCYSTSATNKYLVKTSDGQILTTTGTTIDVSFDKTKDLSTRYIIIYTAISDTTTLYFNYQGASYSIPMLEIVLGGQKWATILFTNDRHGYLRNFEMLDKTTAFSLNGTFSANYLEHLKLTSSYIGSNATITSNMLVDVELPNVTKIEKNGLLGGSYCLRRIDLPNLETTNNSFSSDYVLTELNVPKLKTISSSLFLQQCRNIKKLQLPSIETGVPVFTYCYNLDTLELPDNFKISNWNLSNCTKLYKNTLINILNKLANVTENEEITYTLILGTYNLVKLTEDEIAIGTDKGWVIS